MGREQLVGPGFGDLEGSWIRGPCAALAVSGSTLYAGGNFTTAGGSAANNIAKWDGSSWSALGSGISGIYPMCMRWRCRAARCMRGADFTTAGGNSANYIAQWNGSSWSALGSGIQVQATMEKALCGCAGGVGQHIVCGWRFHDGGRRRSQLHRQMGREQLVGAGFGDERRCGCAGGVGQQPVCRGLFHAAGGITANYIAKWDGNTWSALGSGVNRTVYALAVSGRGTTCMRGAISRRQAASCPATLRGPFTPALAHPQPNQVDHRGGFLAITLAGFRASAKFRWPGFRELEQRHRFHAGRRDQ